MKKSFLIVKENGKRRVRPMDDDEVATLLDAKQIVCVGARLYEKVAGAEPDAPNTYDTKVMVPDVIKRGRGRPPKVRDENS